VGHAPRSTAGLYLVYGQRGLLDATVPVYNLIVIAASLLIASTIGWLLTRTTFGRIMRASADNREMAEALGVDIALGLRARVHPGHRAGNARRRPRDPGDRRDEREWGSS